MLTPEDFATQNLASILRNELIAKTLYLCHDIESFGSGFKRVYSSCMEAGVKCGYEKMAYGFSFIFFRNNPNMPQGTSIAQTPPTDSFTPSEAKVYELLKQPNLTREELAGKIGRTVNIQLFYHFHNLLPEKWKSKTPPPKKRRSARSQFGTIKV